MRNDSLYFCRKIIVSDNYNSFGWSSNLNSITSINWKVVKDKN